MSAGRAPIAPVIAGGVSEAGGFGWGFGVVGVIGLVIAVLAAVDPCRYSPSPSRGWHRLTHQRVWVP